MSRLATWHADGREVMVAGMGRSGVAAVHLLHRHGIPVYAADDGAGEGVRRYAAMVAGLERVTVEVGGHDPGRIARAAALVLSPGIPPTATMVRLAVAAGVPVVAEAQLGLDALTGVPAIMVTGTNGKTTTTALIDHLLRAAGRRSMAAGNIGTALSEVAVTDPPPEWLAVELSSFQLHDCPDVAPTVGVLTNLAPDHLDRYTSLAEYYADKARLFANARPASLWVSNLDDPASRTMVAGVTGRHLAFSTTTMADAWLDRTHDRLMLAGQPLLARADLPLLGEHNVANALAAALAVHATGVPHAAIAAGLPTFRALVHRMEPVREHEGVLWVNDSKATNIASTLVAVRAMSRPYVLLLGGRHKGEPYTALLEAFGPHLVAVVAYGESGDLVRHDLGEAIRVERVVDLPAAVACAQALVPADGAVLLSPACSSYDQFPNYEVRGATFRALVEAL
jgi:UDP-N-acetylmuramoylalanine--D-glutamate ligase